MPILHPLPAPFEADTQADYAHQHLCILCNIGVEVIDAESFDLTPGLKAKLESDFFNGPIPAALLAAPDWAFRTETLPGWEILFLNDHPLQITGGIDGAHTPAPFDLSPHLVALDPFADLGRLSDWPSLRQLSVPHLVQDLDFLGQVPQLEVLVLENISWVQDFTPLAQMTQLKEIHLGNGGYHDHAAGKVVLEKVRAQAPNLPEFQLGLWEEEVGQHSISACPSV